LNIKLSTPSVKTYIYEMKIPFISESKSGWMSSILDISKVELFRL